MCFFNAEEDPSMSRSRSRINASMPSEQRVHGRWQLHYV